MTVYKAEHRTNSQLTISGGDTVRNSALLYPRENKNVGHGDGGMVAAVTDVGPDETAVFEHVYFKGNHGNQGVWIDPHSVEGTVIFRNCTFERLSDAIYGEVAKKGAGNGTVRVEDCYFRNNNIAHIRVSGGSVIDGCVIHNTGNVPENEKGQVNSRGLHSFYNSYGTVEVRNTHVNVGPHNTNGNASAVNIEAHGPQWDIRGGAIKGPRRGAGNVSYRNVGDSPSTAPPPGCPTRPSEAKAGQSSGSSAVATDGGQNQAANTIPESATSVTFSGDGSYEFSTTGKVYRGKSADPEDKAVKSGMNTLAAGVTAGGTDKWYYTGDLRYVDPKNNATYSGPKPSGTEVANDGGEMQPTTEAASKSSMPPAPSLSLEQRLRNKPVLFAVAGLGALALLTWM